MIGRFLLGVGVLMLLAAGAFAQDAPPARKAVVEAPASGKLPIPDAEAQKEARKLVTDVFGKDLAKARTAPERVALGRKMLQAATDEQGRPAAQYALLAIAGEVATEAADVETAMAVAVAIGNRFDADGAKLKTDALARLDKAKGLDPAAMAEHCTQLIDECVAADRYDLAKKAAELGVAAAKKGGDTQALQAAAGRLQEVSGIRTGYEQAQKALAILAADSNNTGAYLTVGRFLCLAKGDWAKGLPMLASSSDKAIKQMAEKEMQNPTTPAGQVELADGWWELAAKEPEPSRRKMREHAAAWYRQAFPSLTGVMKLRAHLRLEECKPTDEAGRWTVIFRSAEPAIWNSDVNKGPTMLAVSLKRVPKDVKYLRLTLLTTRESVIVPVGWADLDKDEGGSGRYRWNGSSKLEFGGNHLGVIDLEGGTGQGTVEVGYSRAGWGFGHAYGVDDRQAWAWAGHSLGKSVFEIAVSSSTKLSAQENRALLGGTNLAERGKLHSVWRRPSDGAWFVLYQDRTFRHYDQDFTLCGEGWGKGSWQNDRGRLVLTSSTGGRFDFTETGENRVIPVPPKSRPKDLPGQ